MGCSASKRDEVCAEACAPAAVPGPFHPDPALEGIMVSALDSVAPAAAEAALPENFQAIAPEANREAQTSARSMSNPLTADFVASMMRSSADVALAGSLPYVRDRSPSWTVEAGFRSASGSDVRLRSFDAVADTALRPVPVTVIASGVVHVTPQDTVDELHDELSDIAAWRGESPALSMDELPGDMHVRRIEGRGNMARMHGFTTDIDQFPASGRLPRKMQSKVDRRVRAWMVTVDVQQ